MVENRYEPFKDKKKGSTWVMGEKSQKRYEPFKDKKKGSTWVRTHLQVYCSKLWFHGNCWFVWLFHVTKRSFKIA